MSLACVMLLLTFVLFVFIFSACDNFIDLKYGKAKLVSLACVMLLLTFVLFVFIFSVCDNFMDLKRKPVLTLLLLTFFSFFCL